MHKICKKKSKWTSDVVPNKLHDHVKREQRKCTLRPEKLNRFYLL